MSNLIVALVFSAAAVVAAYAYAAALNAVVFEPLVKELTR